MRIERKIFFWFLETRLFFFFLHRTVVDFLAESDSLPAVEVFKELVRGRVVDLPAKPLSASDKCKATFKQLFGVCIYFFEERKRRSARAYVFICIYMFCF